MIDKKVTDGVYASMEALVKQRHDLKAEIDALTEQGCVEASLHWREGKYLYLLYPVGRPDKKRKSYVGVEAEKQEKAKARVERFKEREVLLAEYRKLDGFIQDAEKMLTAIAEGLDAKVNNKKLDYSVGNRFERIMRSVEYGW